jgi:hypothetical protein
MEARQSTDGGVSNTALVRQYCETVADLAQCPVMLSTSTLV